MSAGCGCRLLPVCLGCAYQTGAEGCETSYTVVGVVREKFVFKERPKPVLRKWNHRVKQQKVVDANKEAAKQRIREACVLERQAEEAAAAQRKATMAAAGPAGAMQEAS